MRYAFSMKKQDTHQTGLESIGFSDLDFSSLRYFSLGATAHQPMATAPSKASTPIASLDVASFFIIFRLPSPFDLSYSLFVSLHVIHQQPPQAPRGPNNFSNASHVFAESGLNVMVPDVDIEQIDIF